MKKAVTWFRRSSTGLGMGGLQGILYKQRSGIFPGYGEAYEQPAHQGSPGPMLPTSALHCDPIPAKNPEVRMPPGSWAQQVLTGAVQHGPPDLG